MKPIKLTMFGFMTYKNKTEIDFTKLYSSRVFLISGDTGSGKTSIFDAISFALFGQISRTDDQYILRSDFLGPDDAPTYVNFVFNVDNRVYEIERRPNQLAKKKIKPGVSISHEAELYEIVNGEKKLLADKPSLANPKIKEIIGLDVNQLKKVMLLAQGQFSDFLSAKSDEKAKLLSEIFQTSDYKNIQENLKNKSTQASDRLKNLDDKLFESINKDDILRTDIDLSLIYAHNFEKILNLIKSKKNGLEEDLLENRKKTKQLNKDISLKIENLALAKKENENIEKYLNFLEVKKQKEKNLNFYTKLKTDLDRAKAAHSIKPYWDNYRELCDKNLKNKTDLQKFENEYKLAKESLEELEKDKKNIAIFNKKIIDLNLNLSKEKEKLEGLETFLEEKRNLDSLSTTIEKNKEKSNIYEENKNILSEISNRLILMSENYILKSKEESDLKSKLFEKTNQLEKNKQVLEIARKNENNKYYIESLKEDIKLLDESLELKEEEYQEALKYQKQIEIKKYVEILNETGVCPVCGSFHDEKIILEEFFDFDLEKISEDLNKRKLERQSIYNEIRIREKDIVEDLGEISTIEFQKEGIEKQIEEFTKKYNEISNQLQEMDEKDLSLKKEKDKLEKSNLKLEKDINEDRKLKEKYDQLLFKHQSIKEKYLQLDKNDILIAIKDKEKEIEKLYEKIEKIEDKYKACKEKILSLQASMNSLNDLIFKYDKEIQLKKSDIEEKIEEKFNGIDEFKENLSSYQQLIEREEEISKFFDQYREIELNIKSLSFCKDKEIIDTNDLEKSLLENRKKFEILNSKLADLKYRIINLQTSINEVRDIEKEYILKKTDADVLAKLSSIANGSMALVKGREKLDFETFVLIYYFEKVLAYANKRLYRLSNGQFIMVRKNTARDLRSKYGLDIEILDANTGKKRPAITLSGGETFLASLSLALGLSDEISAENGGIKIDTLFIDEGFGTLSEDYLQNAISTIEDLSYEDKFIGLISHVRELKESIDAKILVKYDKTEGSEVEILI